MKSKKRVIRYSVLGTLIILVWVTQAIPAMGEGYARSVYPVISYVLSGFSNFFPFALGDLFIAFSITGIILYPIYARIRQKLSWKTILRRDTEYLAWIYVWFYLAWGLNYSQRNFYERTGIPYITYTPENFDHFVNQYIYLLNESYVPITRIDKETICKEAVSQYSLISDSLGVHHPPHSMPQVKTMLFTPLISMVGVTGSMGPFFCEFTLNGDLLPPQYPATYTHELAHLLGITSEAEANFYAYQVCTRSTNREIRFSGYFSILGHVLANARRLMTEEQKNAVIEKMGDGYKNWQNELERIGTIGIFEKNTSEEKISKITKCDTHTKIGVSSDGKYDCYLSTNSGAESNLLDELKRTEIQIIDKKERPENGFVLSEKTDLENTEAFNKESVKDLRKLSTKDINGKDFTSKDFEKYDLTMVNVFATWCTACVNEIPDLVEVQNEMKSKGVNIVGVVTDTVDDTGENKEAIEKSKLIHEKTKASYPFLMPDKTNFNGRLNGIQAMPETFFVDSNGNIVGDTYSGAKSAKEWKQVIEKELEKIKNK